MILCFSGTGNSRYVAQLLADHLNERITHLNITTPLNINGAEQRIVWVFPVYSWGIPAFVKHFMEHVTINCDCLHHLVLTCGDDTGLTHTQWRKIAKKRGWHTAGTYSVQMPNTYVLLPGFDTDTAEVAHAKLSKAPTRVAEISKLISANSRIDDVVTGSFPWIKTRLFYPFFMRYMTSPKHFHPTAECIGCGKCEAVCPLKNITYSRTKSPRWGNSCTLCLGCYNVCPHHAVAYGKATANKGQSFLKAKSTPATRQSKVSRR